MYDGKAIVRVSNPHPWYVRSRHRFNGAHAIAARPARIDRRRPLRSVAASATPMHHDLLANVVNALRPDPAKVFLTGPGRSLTRVAFLA